MVGAEGVEGVEGTAPGGMGGRDPVTSMVVDEVHRWRKVRAAAAGAVVGCGVWKGDEAWGRLGGRDHVPAPRAPWQAARCDTHAQERFRSH
jgi:hypothetical protein